MSIAAIIADMVRAGVDPDIIGRAAEAMATPVKGVDPAAEKRRAYDRERKRLLPSDWSDVRRAVFERDGWVCAYCNAEVSAPHCDHVKPLAQGGSSTPDNLVTSCPSCNLAKRNRSPEEWMGL